MSLFIYVSKNKRKSGLLISYNGILADYIVLHKSLLNDDFFGKLRSLKLRCRSFGGIFFQLTARLCFAVSIWCVTVYLRSALTFVSHNLQKSTDSSHENTSSPNSNKEFLTTVEIVGLIFSIFNIVTAQSFKIHGVTEEQIIQSNSHISQIIFVLYGIPIDLILSLLR